MDIDKLKENWGSLNERLEQNEILNKRIIQEMIKNRANSAQSRLFRYDLLGLIVIGIFSILLPFIWKNTLMTFPSFLLLESAMVLYLGMESWKMSCLLRFNTETKNIYELNRLMLRYRWIVKWNYTYGMLIAALVVIGFFLFQGSNLLLDAWRLWTMGGAFAVGALFGFLQIRFQNKTIAAIEQSLKELEEFRE
ncbi:hypothetical protein M2480_001248 [Parabacteroides sp. PFB2-12]|uniref:hypothetical protein n=1 Tax=unclassified Parabacteroides TaxID=2649774 RepID=UPI0024730F93|nr:MULTISPECIES: hypothetical protein [unclassified Parabacteroides]MDH6343259.1 hypothetical protein [Parabacteroides sp. PM6-13]MDH6390275.1 hypothetical protein [Parabacteroides sp. PFB2-12]